MSWISKGAFVWLVDAGQFTGHLGCVIGKTRRRAHPWEVSLRPEKDDECMITTVQLRENQMSPCSQHTTKSKEAKCL